MQYSPTAMIVISHHFVNARRHVMMLLPYIVHLVHSSFEGCLVVNSNEQSNRHWSCYFCTCNKLWINSLFVLLQLLWSHRMWEIAWSKVFSEFFQFVLQEQHSRPNTENYILYKRKFIHAITLKVLCSGYIRSVGLPPISCGSALKWQVG